MHKKLVNRCTIELILKPDGPILIKAGKEGADPTKPDMEFVETYHSGGRSIYLPGSSLKGAIRAHAERIVRTIGSDRYCESTQLWASDPLNDQYEYLNNQSPCEIYRRSSFTDQIFGNTSIASRFRIEDAYPVAPKQLKIEERNGVAIDRVFGSVAVGPFNYQVCTSGEFKTKLHLKNFTLAQLGLIGLVLRDLDEGWFSLGFAKSRGLGVVMVQLDRAIVQYPGCIIKNEQIQLLGTNKQWSLDKLLGVGAFLEPDECKKYGVSEEEESTSTYGKAMDLGIGVQLCWQGNEQVKDLFTRAVEAWQMVVQGVTA